MADRRDKQWEDDSPKYSPEQVEAVLRETGVEIDGETHHDFVCYCPYHGNRHSPAFGVSRTSGKFICYNHACNKMGTLVELVKFTSGRNEFEARRLIIKMARETERTFVQKLEDTLRPPDRFPTFPQETIDAMVKNFWRAPWAIEYMTKERGFTENTLRKFEVGFSAVKRILAVPMHDPNGNPVGVIGRPATKDRKRFRNSDLLPTSKTLWNLHRAKRVGGTVGITEASFDAMRTIQAIGSDNVVACLGGHISESHLEQLDRHFDTIVILTDFDEKQFHNPCIKCTRLKRSLCHGHNPGRDMGLTIAKELPKKNILWGAYDEKVVYPSGKDMGDHSDSEIRQIWKNAVPNYIYQQWNLY